MLVLLVLNSRTDSKDKSINRQVNIYYPSTGEGAVSRLLNNESTVALCRAATLAQVATAVRDRDL